MYSALPLGRTASGAPESGRLRWPALMLEPSHFSSGDQSGVLTSRSRRHDRTQIAAVDGDEE